MKHLFRLIAALLLIATNNAFQANAESKDEITLTVSSDGATKDDALKNALRTAIEQAYGAFVSANTTILNDELVKDEIVTVSNGSIKDYKEISFFEKPDGSGYMVTVNTTVSLPNLITYAKNHGSECEFAGNTFAMDFKLFNLQKDNELKVLYNAIPKIESLAKTTMEWNLKVYEPKVIDVEFDLEIKKSTEYKRHRDINYRESVELPYKYDIAYGKIRTSEVKYDNYDAYFVIDNLPINSLLNKQIKRPDGAPAIEKDEDVLNRMEQFSNGKYALLRFDYSWLPKGENDALKEFFLSLFNSLSLDYESYKKYSEQGHDLALISHYDWGIEEDDQYSDLRNTPKDIALWKDSVMTVLNKIKHNFEIVDNTGQKSSFNPLKLYEWMVDADDKNIVEFLNLNQEQEFYNKNRRPLTKLFHVSLSNDNEEMSWEGFEPFYIFPKTKQRIQCVKDNSRYVISIGGEGLLDKMSYIYYNGKFNIYDQYNKDYGRTSWITYIFIPFSEISKYSSFKIVHKE